MRITSNSCFVRKFLPLFLLSLAVVSQAALGQVSDTSNSVPGSGQTEHQYRKSQRKEKVNDLIRREEDGELVYHKQFAFGIRLTTDGYGASYEIGWMKTLNKTDILQFELNEIKDPKEYKVTVSNDFTSGSPFIYGKQNYFYQFKVGYGQELRIGGKGNKNGVAVSALYAGGLSVGLLRPYYIQILDSAGALENIKLNSTDSAEFLGNDIYGGTGLSTGWGELKIQPGVHAKLALRFDYGRYNEVLSAVEIGINAELYAQTIPIMVLAPNHQFFFNSYISLEFGKRK